MAKMFLPKLLIQPIDPLENVAFITRYLSMENHENKTRPFFEKTILLYKELSGINEIADEEQRKQVIKEAVLRRLEENKEEIEARIKHFQEVFDSFIYDFLEAQCKLFHYQWKQDQPEIKCYVGYLPFYPRSTEDKVFFVSYQDEERVFSGAVHEMNHMIFFEKWKEMHGGNCKEKRFPDPLWYLEEIVVDPTLNDERVKKYTLYENKAYPQFYEPDEKVGCSIMDQVKNCYSQHPEIEDFLLESYEIVSKWCAKMECEK